MPGRQRHKLIAPTIKERVAADKKGAHLLLSDGREGRVNIAFAASMQNMDSLSGGARRRLDFLRLALGSGTFWVDEDRDHSSRGHQFAQ
jgi:hypothetical protein